MQIKKKKQLTVEMNGDNAQIKAKEVSDAPQAKAKEAMPMSVSASLQSLKKAPSISANVASAGHSLPSAKTEAMDTGHSEAYKERIKKRAK